MRKYVHSVLCLIIIGILCFSGCDFLNRKPADDDYFLTGNYDSWTESNNEQSFQWIIKPSVPASNIIVADFSQVNSTQINRYFLNVAIIYSDGQYGFIDYDGNMVVEPSYDHYYICSCGQIILYNTINDLIAESCTLDTNGRPTYNAYIHEDSSPEYYWDDDTEQLYVKKKNEYFAAPYYGYGTIVAELTTATEISYNTYSVPTDNNPVYAVFKDGSKITDFIYEDYYAPAYRSTDSTAIALKSNGKWGYVDSNGNELLSYKCEDILSSFNGSYNGISDKSHPYLYSEGFVPVCIDSNYSYYNKEGKAVVSEGIFEQARPVINGKAWVKCDGKWGVIQLGEIREAFVSTTASTLSTHTYSSTSTTSSTDVTSINQTSGGTTTNAQTSTLTPESDIPVDSSTDTALETTTTEQTTIDSETTTTIQ